MSVRLEAATDADLDAIRAHVARLALDGEDLRREQFLVVREDDRLVAFGRIKPYAHAFELGCVGVVEDARGKGYARLVVEELVRRFPTPDVWITTDRPEVFAKLGFAPAPNETGPPEVVDKITRICGWKPGVVLMLRRK